MPNKSSFLLLFPLLALGIYVGSQSAFNSRLIYPFLVLFVVWICLAYRGKEIKGLFWITIALGTFLIGQMSVLPKQSWIVPEERELFGVAYAVQELTFDVRILVRLMPSRFLVAVHLPQDTQISIGDELFFKGVVSQPPRAPNPGVFCYQGYLERLGVFGLCYPIEFHIKPTVKQDLLTRIRVIFRNNVVKHVRDPSLVLGLVLGERDAISPERKEQWRLLGVSHLLAISGMHISFLFLGMNFLIRFLPARPVFKLILTQLGLLGYTIVAGSGASVWRAFLACTIGGFASFRGRRLDPLQIWATVGWFLLLVSPNMLFNLSFTLSFAASGGILLWAPVFKSSNQHKILSYIRNSLVISLIAQLSLFPLLINYFGEVALLGPLATLIFLPFVVVLLLGGLAVAVGLGPLGVASLVNMVMGIIEVLENVLAPWARQWRPDAIGSFEIYLWWLLFLYVGWKLRQPQLIKPRRTYLHLTIVTLVVLSVTSLPSALLRPLEVTAVNVGQGDCYYIRTPRGLHILIDGGGDSPYWQQRGRNVGEERLVPYLRHRQVQRLDYVILSHPHEDHLHGLLAVLEHFEVGMVVDNGHSHSSLSYERYLDLISEKEISHHIARQGDQLRLSDGITLEVLFPDQLRPDFPSAYNNNSLLLRFKYGGVKLLFTGDLENAILYDLVHNPTINLGAHWLKVPHHGSRSSLLEEFYQAVDPKWAVISVGPNSFGHPHQEVLDLLDKLDIHWRTTEKEPVSFLIWWGLWGRFVPAKS